MADPIVHITNGIPDVGTGNITTLGQTLLDGANITLGALADTTVAAGAAGSINAHLRSISRDIAGGIVLQSGGNVIGSVNQAGAPWSISGTVSVSGTVTVTGSVSASQSGTWNINNIAGTISLPTGAATAAKQPLPGTPGSPSADVITVQGSTSMTPLKVDGSATTQPISGNVGITGNVNCVQVTSPWVTSISGNVTCVQSGNWAARCVGNAGGIFDFSSAQNVATPAQALLIGAEFNAVPTTITTGNSSPLQLDSAANLLVNVKTGTVAATQSGNWSSRLQDGAGNAITSDARGTARPLAVEILDASGNQVTSFGGAGGTSSNFGSAFPTAGTAVGVKDSAGTNMTFLQVNSSNALKVDGSAVTQPISGTVTANQGGTWNITNISGTISLPTGAATAANQPTAAALGSTTSGQTGHLSLGAVTTAAPSYTTAQTNALSLTTTGSLRVDGSGATQPISGTVTVTQGTAANLNATVTGTVAATQSGNWTSRIVGNAGAVLDFAGQNATAPANSILIGGEFNTTPTTISSGNASPLQLDSAGNLLVNVKVGGGTGGTSSTFGAAMPGVGTAIGLYDGTNMVRARGDETNGIWVNIKAGAGSGGTASNFGSAVPSAGTAAGFSDGTNMQLGHVFDLDTGAGTEYNQGVVLRKPASGGSVVFGSSTDPIRVDPTGTTTQPVSLTSTTITGTVAVSGTVAATQSGTWTVQPGNTANTTPWLMTINQGGNSATVSAAGALKVDGSAVTQPISAASLPLPTGAATAANQPTPVGVGSTTSGQQGALVFGAVTTAAPTYTTAQSNPLSLNTAGGLRVDGSGVTQPISGSVSVTGTTTVSGTVTANQGGTWTVQPGNTANTTAWLVTGTGGTFPITAASLPLPTGASTSANQPSNAAIGSTTSGQTGNLLMGAVTTAAPAYTTAQTNPLSLTTTGGLRVDGSGVTQPVSIAAAVTVQQATAANLNATVTGTVAATQSGTWTVQQGTPPWLVGGDVASGSADSGNPVKIGAVARTANPTAVTTGQRVNLLADKLGKLVAVGALREVKGVQKTSITTTTETTVVSSSAGIFNDVYAIIVTNKSATTVFVDFRDSTGGTVRATIAAPANDTRGITLTVDSAMVQSANTNNWTATLSSAVTSVEITMLYVQNL